VFALFVQPPLVFLLSCILGGKCWKNYEGGYLNSSVKTSAVSAILTTLTAFSSTPVILSSADSYRKMHFLVVTAIAATSIALQSFDNPPLRIPRPRRVIRMSMRYRPTTSNETEDVRLKFDARQQARQR
ncbi:hypothetical protein CPB85DRAFT_1264373, partial [Mucidula mucida]